MICKKCGNQMDDGAAFCTECGNLVNGISLEKPFIPDFEKAPECGKQLSTDDNLDPRYETFKSGVKIARWVFCILWIIECFKGSGIVVAVILALLCIGFTAVMEGLVMLGYEYLRTERFQSVRYSSYITSHNAESIVHVLAEYMSEHNMSISARNESQFGNVIEIIYSGRKYAAVFSSIGGNFFVVVCCDDGKDKYANMCKDVPVIVYHIQEVLRNL